MEAANIGAGQLPGLTLHVMQDELSGCAGKKFKAHGQIVLSAEVHDYGIYEEVKEKLDGMTVHTVNDVPQALIKAAQRRAKKAEQRQMETSEQSRRRVDELEANLSFTTQERDALRFQLEEAQREIAQLRETVDWQDQAMQSRS